MRSWAAPEPPPPRRSRYLAVAFVAWVGALYLGYRWVWSDPWAPFRSNAPNALTEFDTAADLSPLERESPATPRDVPVPRVTTGERPIPAEKSAPVADTTSTEPDTAANPRPRREGELPGCEAFQTDPERETVRMPTHLGQSPVGSFIGETAWLKPCQGKRRRSLRFCAAVRDGRLVGLSLHAVPTDLTLELCVREQALKVPLRNEPSLSILDTQLTL